MKLRAIIFGVSFFLSMSVFGHTGLSSSSPSSDSSSKQSPENIILNFSGPVRPLKVVLLNDQSEEIDFGFKRSKKPKAKFNYPVAPLPVGNYKIEWSVMGNDGHKMRGTINFTIEP